MEGDVTRKLAALGVATALGVTTLFLLVGSGSGRGPHTAFANVTPPANTPGPTPTPMPGDLYDLWDIDAGPGLFHCIARTDQDPITLARFAMAHCYTEVGTAFIGSEPPCDAVHGGGGGPTPVVPGEGSCGGHAAPPPYMTLPPVMFSGSYDAGNYTVSVTGCFADVGGTMGPNIIVQLSALAGTGSVKVYAGQTNANCSAGTPSGSYSTWPVTMTGVNPQRDSDGDGCKDAVELFAGRPGGSTTCGDDPWNPYDTPSGSPLNVTGSWDIVMETVRADVGSPGFYYECKADLQVPSGSNVTAPILCYVDSTVVTVNPQAANCAVNPGPSCSTSGINNCPPYGPANPKFCGDGLPGAAPPGCALSTSCANLAGQPPRFWGDTNGCPTLPCNVSEYQFAPITSEASLSGTIGGTPATISLSGCHANLGGDGNVYIQAKINAYTGLGWGNLYANAGCTASGAAISVRIFAVRQAPGVEPSAGSQNSAGRWTGCGGTDTAVGYTLCRDSDGDGCPDQVELTNASGSGGLRDPLNRWDFFNPEKVNTPHKQTVADILKVNAQYGKNQGNALYTIDTDRTAIIGGNVWTLGPPDGQQTVADILAANKQYNHNC
jgi:hypothetical protein